MAMRYVLKNTAGTGEMPFDSEEARSAYYDKNKQYWQDPNAGAATPTTRYSDPAPKTDDVSSYYAKIKDQTAMPDEARRQSLRADAERDVQTQLLAIQNASNVLIADERARQAKAAAQGKAQVSGVSRLSGLGGSTVASQRQKTQAEMAAENERRAVAVLEADTARQIASARGIGQAAAEDRFKQEQLLASDAQKTYGGYIERLASQTPKETALIEVGGVLYNPVTKETVLDTRVLKTNEPVYREVGGSLYEITKGADGKTVSTLVQQGAKKGTDIEAPVTREFEGIPHQWNAVSAKWEPVVVQTNKSGTIRGEALAKTPEAKKLAGIGALKNAVENYRTLISEVGSASVFTPGSRQQLNSAKEAINLALKEAEALGALQAPDIDLVKRMIPDVTSEGFWGTLGGIASGIGKAGRAIETIDKQVLPIYAQKARNIYEQLVAQGADTTDPYIQTIARQAGLDTNQLQGGSNASSGVNEGVITDPNAFLDSF